MKYIFKNIWIIAVAFMFLVTSCEDDEPIYITINKLNAVVEQNQTLQLTAEISGSGDKEMSKSIIWTSSDTNNEYISIDKNGLVKGLKITPGIEVVTITASLPSGEYATSSIRVVKQNPKLKNLIINVKDYYFMTVTADTTITATVIPDTLTKTYNAEWSIDKPEVVKIKEVYIENGKLKAVVKPLTEGVAKLKVTMGNKSTSVNIHVGPSVVLSWKDGGKPIGLTSFTLYPNTELDISVFAKVLPDDDATMESVNYKWTVEGQGVLVKNIRLDDVRKNVQHATLVAGDLLTQTKLNITVNDQKITADINVRNKYPVEDIEILPEKLEVNSGSIVSFSSLRIIPSKAQDDWINDIKYTSSDENIAVVDKNGSIKGVKPGDANIIVSLQGITKTIPIKVNPIVDQIIISGGVTDILAGNTTKWDAKIMPESSQDAFTINWESSNTSVAEVNSEGVITAKGKGKAIIKASAGGKEATREITVKDLEDKDINIIVNADNIKDDESAIYRYNDDDYLEILLDTKENHNYTIIIKRDNVDNGTYNFEDAELVYRHLSNIILKPLKGTITISDGAEGKQMKINASVERTGVENINVNIDVDVIEY